jgi:DNA-binding protein HU-beta
MKKAEIIQRLVSEHGAPSKAAAERQLEQVLECITHGLQSDEKVEIHGFGTFGVRERAARRGRNPQTGEQITIPASRKASFKAAKKLNDAIAR